MSSVLLITIIIHARLHKGAWNSDPPRMRGKKQRHQEDLVIRPEDHPREQCPHPRGMHMFLLLHDIGPTHRNCLPASTGVNSRAVR